MGRSDAHGSHKLFFHEPTRYFACSVCGRVGAVRMEQLAKQCPCRVDKKGKDNLRRLERNLMPGASAAARSCNAGNLRAKRPSRHSARG